MGKHTGMIVALVLALAPAAATAFEIQKFPIGPAGQNFADPDEKQPILGYSERDSDSSARVQPRSGFNFSMSNGNSSTGYNPNFIPGLTVPRQFGPAVDPRTGDPYPGR